MAIVAQLVRASVCGSESRGFKSHLSPRLDLIIFNCPKSYDLDNGPNSYELGKGTAF